MPHTLNKFKARKVKEGGITFDSQAEHRRFCVLRLRERAGEIRDLEAHPSWELNINGTKIGRYTADSRYLEGTGLLVIEDVKSGPTMTAAASLRIRVFQAIYGLKVTLVGKHVGKVREFKKPKVAA